MLSPVLGFIHSFQSTCYNTFTRRMSNGAKQGVAPVACAPPLFLPRPELKYIYVLHTSAPPRTYLVRATLLLSPIGAIGYLIHMLLNFPVMLYSK